MKKSIVSGLVFTLLSTSVFASILKTVPGDKSVEDIKIAQEGTVSLNNQDVPVSIIGAGLRKKKIALAQLKVYVAELLSSDASKFVRTETEALESLETARTIAIRLNFVRKVDAETVQKSFSEALLANKININDAAISQFLDAVVKGGEAASGKSLTIVTQKNADKTEVVTYEDTNGKATSVSGPEGFSKQVMAIWLGTPSDDGVGALKQQIIKGL